MDQNPLAFRRTALRACCILAALLTAGCGIRRDFPVLQPVTSPSRSDLAAIRAQKYFIKARDYDRRGFPRMAERFYEMAYELDPKSPTLHRLLLSHYLASGKFTQALLLVKGNKDVEELPEESVKLLANIYVRLGRFASAAEVLESLDTLTDKQHYSLCAIYDAMGEYAKAAAMCRRFLSEHPESLSVGLRLGKLYEKLRDFDRAESTYIALEEHFPRDIRILQALSTTCLLRGDTATALDLLRTAAALDSSSMETLSALAQIHIGREDYEKAIPYYTRLFEAPEVGKIYGRTLALLYYYTERYDEASSLLQELIAENVDDPELHFYLGMVLAAREELTSARIEYRKALTLKPSFVEAWQQVCFLTFRDGDTAEALSWARRFTEKMEKESVAWRTHGTLLNAAKKYGEAVDPLRKAVERAPEDAAAWFELGSALERTGKIDEAADAFRTVLRLRPGDAQTANYLAYMWTEHDMRLDSARTLLESALEKDPDNGAYIDSYAWLFYKMGRFDSALVHIRKAILKLDDDPVIYEHLGDILAEMGKRGEAIEAYEKSLELGTEKPAEIEGKIEKLRNGP